MAKVRSQLTVKYRSWGHISCVFLLASKRYILIKNINLLTLIGLQILPWTKNLTLLNWPKSEVSGLWNIGHDIMPAPLIEIYPHVKNELSTTNRFCESTWAKILTEISGPWNIGRKVMALVDSCSFHKNTATCEISTCYHLQVLRFYLGQKS